MCNTAALASVAPRALTSPFQQKGHAEPSRRRGTGGERAKLILSSPHLIGSVATTMPDMWSFELDLTRVNSDFGRVHIPSQLQSIAFRNTERNKCTCFDELWETFALDFPQLKIIWDFWGFLSTHFDALSVKNYRKEQKSHDILAFTGIFLGSSFLRHFCFINNYYASLFVFL